MYVARAFQRNESEALAPLLETPLEEVELPSKQELKLRVSTLFPLRPLTNPENIPPFKVCCCPWEIFVEGAGSILQIGPGKTPYKFPKSPTLA